MKDIKNINRVVIIVMLFVSLFVFKGCYVRQETGYTLGFDSKDKGIEYQVFYTTEMAPDYTEEKSVKLQTSGNTQAYEHYEVRIPIAENIKDLRLDFGNAPEQLTISNITLIGEQETQISLDNVITGVSGDIESYELVGDYLLINSNKNDPYSVLTNVNSTPYQNKVINYSDLVDACILYFMGVGLVWYLIKRKGSKKVS